MSKKKKSRIETLRDLLEKNAQMIHALYAIREKIVSLICMIDPEEKIDPTSIFPKRSRRRRRSSGEQTLPPKIKA